MGYYLMVGTCVGCGRLFGFHPHQVPSILRNGIREPVCLDCINRANPIRKAQGLEEIVPLPDAYEPMSEAEGEALWEDKR